MRFKYKATNTEGKQLTGVINAPSEEAARIELNNLGFSILEIREATDQDTHKAELAKFEFEATDKNGKKIKGSIPAKTPLLAYKRLIEEYQFTIQYLAVEGISEEEKAENRQKGITALQTEYELAQQKEKGQEIKSTIETPEFIAEKKRLGEEINEIIGKINELFAKFEGKISPDKKAEIDGCIDKLLRIKSSNNLEYIKNTCEELLKKVQSEELFLTTEKHDQERQSLVLESQKMMLDLQKSTAGKVDMTMKLKTNLETYEQKLEGTKFEFLSNTIKSIGKYLEVEPELQMLKDQLKAIRAEKWDSLKIAIKASKETRPAAWEAFKTNQQKEKEVRKKLKDYRGLRHDKNLVIKKERHIYFIEEIETFTGWLLFFYLAYYFLGHYVTLRGLNIEPFLGVPFDLSQSALFKYLLAIIFLVHAAASLKVNFFLRSSVANGFLLGGTIVLSLVTIFNF